MSYVESNLMKGEEIIATGIVHWWIYFTGAFWSLIGVIAVSSGSELSGIPWFVFIIGAYYLLKAAIYKYTTELVITNKRIIAKFGLISRKTIELTHKNVESLGVSQDIAGRLLDYGSIKINGTGGSKAPIRKISAPLKFRMKANEIIEAEQS